MHSRDLLAFVFKVVVIKNNLKFNIRGPLIFILLKLHETKSKQRNKELREQ